MFPPGSLFRRNPSLCPPPGVPVIDWSDPINLGLIARILLTPPSDVSNQNGSITSAGGPGFAPSPMGQMGSLTGSAQYYSVPYGPIQCPQQITISAWFLPVSMVAGEVYTIVCRPQSSSWVANYAGYMLRVFYNSSTSQDLEFFVGNSSTYDYNDYPVTISNGVLYNAIATYNGSTMEAYLNGVYLGSYSPNFAIGYQNNEPLLIGARPAYSDCWSGYLSNIFMAARVLNPGEILRLYTDPWAGLIFPRDRVMAQLAAIRGATTIALAQKSWVWLGQGAPPAQAIAAAQQAWNWHPQAPVANLNVAAGQKAWAWRPQAPAANQSVAVAQRVWAWSAAAPLVAASIALSRRAWNWIANPLPGFGVAETLYWPVRGVVTALARALGRGASRTNRD